MTADIAAIDAHELPPDHLRAHWKLFTRLDGRDLDQREDILSYPEKKSEFRLAGVIPSEKLRESFGRLHEDQFKASEELKDAPIIYHDLLPGLLLVPSILPPEVQWMLLDRLVHRDLSESRHQTNLHLHYELPYRQAADGQAESFFLYPPDSTVTFEPKDPEIHRPLSIKQVLSRRLHWETLGGQYDWTNREYPAELPPRFPPDIAGFLEALFPETSAQAAIVNFYTPGDTMMMHRDVSEETDKGLVSISLGCDCLFVIAPSNVAKRDPEAPDDAVEKQSITLRLRSGDAIYMTGESRFAWHGVPKVLKGTCPPYLADWPAKDGKYEDWKGWMGNKRINLNVRQMKD